MYVDSKREQTTVIIVSRPPTLPRPHPPISNYSYGIEARSRVSSVYKYSAGIGIHDWERKKTALLRARESKTTV